MTRFARAKGSKSSNERVPDQATPWHVMKDHLEAALVNKQNQPQAKAKSAKELINEKDDLYYAKSLGSVNTDWAEFESSKPKVNQVKSGRVEKKSKNKNKKLNKSVESSDVGDTSNQEPKIPKFEKSTEAKEKTEAPSEFESSKPKVNQVKNGRVEKKSKNKNKKLKKSVESSDVGDTSNQEPKTPKFEKSTEAKEETEAPSEPNVGQSKSKKRKFKEKKNFEKTNGKVEVKDKYEGDILSKRQKQFGGSIPRKYQKKTAKIRDDKEHKRRKPETPVMRVTINDMDVEIVKYDGFPVKKEDAERLTKLRKEMVLKGIPKPDIDAAMKLERRKCEKALARIRKQVCFHCRKAGHNLSECPELGREESATGICFKCGSTEHTHFECKVQKSEDYKFAKCFICREHGHIAKQCPDNPKGLYPDGGGCKICGDVTHLKKDCPDLVKEKEDAAITLDTIQSGNLELLDGDAPVVKKPSKSTKNIIKF